MNKLSTLLTFLILFLNYGAMQVLAQEKFQEFVVLKMIIKKEVLEHQLKVPVEKSFDDAKLTGGDFVVDHCVKCPLTSYYGFFGFAEKVNQNETRLSITINFKNQKACGCNDKIFIVSRNKPIKLKLKCGIEIIAQYESETTNN